MNTFFKTTLLGSVLTIAGIGAASAQTDFNPVRPVGQAVDAIVTAPLAIVGAPLGAESVYEGRSAYSPGIGAPRTEPEAFYNETDETGKPTGITENPSDMGN